MELVSGTGCCLGVMSLLVLTLMWPCEADDGILKSNNGLINSVLILHDYLSCKSAPHSYEEEEDA